MTAVFFFFCNSSKNKTLGISTKNNNQGIINNNYEVANIK